MRKFLRLPPLRATLTARRESKHIGFHSLVTSTALDRAVARAGRVADARLGGDARTRRPFTGGPCRELDLSETAVRRWVGQAAVDAGERDGLTTEEREEPPSTRGRPTTRPRTRPCVGWSNSRSGRSRTRST